MLISYSRGLWLQFSLHIQGIINLIKYVNIIKTLPLKHRSTDNTSLSEERQLLRKGEKKGWNILAPYQPNTAKTISALETGLTLLSSTTKDKLWLI